MEIKVNGQVRTIPAEWESEPLLQVLREPLGLAGAKFGCGAGLCGACTVLVDGEPTRSCVTPVSAVGQRPVETLEGLAPAGGLHPVQALWLKSAIAQCGYCQSGHIMATVALLRRVPRPNRQQVEEALAGHLCRCGTQPRMRAAIEQLGQVG